MHSLLDKLAHMYAICSYTLAIIDVKEEVGQQTKQSVQGKAHGASGKLPECTKYLGESSGSSYNRVSKTLARQALMKQWEEVQNMPSSDSGGD